MAKTKKFSKHAKLRILQATGTLLMLTGVISLVAAMGSNPQGKRYWVAGSVFMGCGLLSMSIAEAAIVLEQAITENSSDRPD